MRLDHLTFAAGPEGLKADVERLSDLLHAKFVNGGVHPQFGTRSYILPLANNHYFEAVEWLGHPVVEQASFGRAVRARSEAGGGWLGWAFSVADITPLEERLEFPHGTGSRVFPDERVLTWKHLGVKGLLTDPQLPYFIEWTSPDELLPQALGGDIAIAKIDISGSKERLEEWLGIDVDGVFDGIEFTFNSPNGQPGIDAVTFVTQDRQIVRI
jgi:hypothetical protein